MQVLTYTVVMRSLQLVDGTAVAPTTYPVGGYVNMNQLAHMALQHQGLCPTADKKHDHEDVGHEQSHVAGYRAEQWEDIDPRGRRPNPHSADSAGIGTSRLSLQVAPDCHRGIGGICPQFTILTVPKKMLKEKNVQNIFDWFDADARLFCKRK